VTGACPDLVGVLSSLLSALLVAQSLLFTLSREGPVLLGFPSPWTLRPRCL